MLTQVLLIAILLLSIVLLVVILKTRKVEASEIESAMSGAWLKLGLGEQVGRIAAFAERIQQDYRSLEQMLRVPRERAYLAEIALETILSDQLPPDMFGIRQRILDGRIPDACIRSTVGTICIDSKFPLDNYRKMLETAASDEKDRCKKQFLRDVAMHLDKIAADYVCPEKGSAEFAFAYIHSESVYSFLVSEGFELLHDYVKECR